MSVCQSLHIWYWEWYGTDNDVFSLSEKQKKGKMKPTKIDSVIEREVNRDKATLWNVIAS